MNTVSNNTDSKQGEAIRLCLAMGLPDNHACIKLAQAYLDSRASLAAPQGDAQAIAQKVVGYLSGKYIAPDVASMEVQPIAEIITAASSPVPAEPPPSDAKFVPPAEDALHIAICQAVQEHHGPSANAILCTALNDYKPTQLTRTEFIRVQQRSGSGEVTAVMVSPAEPRQEGEQELWSSDACGLYRNGAWVLSAPVPEVAASLAHKLNERVTPPETPVVAREAARNAAREWLRSERAAFYATVKIQPPPVLMPQIQKREDEAVEQLAAIITRYLVAAPVEEGK